MPCNTCPTLPAAKYSNEQVHFIMKLSKHINVVPVMLSERADGIQVFQDLQN